MSQLTVLGQQSTNEWLGERMSKTGGSGRVVFPSIHRRRASEDGEDLDNGAPAATATPLQPRSRPAGSGVAGGRQRHG